MDGIPKMVVAGPQGRAPFTLSHTVLGCSVAGLISNHWKILPQSRVLLQSKTEFWAPPIFSLCTKLGTWQSQIFAFQALYWFSFRWPLRSVVFLHLWKFQHLWRNLGKFIKIEVSIGFAFMLPNCSQHSKEPALIFQVTFLLQGIMSSE